MFEPLIWWVFCMFAWVVISWHVYMNSNKCYIACKVSYTWASKLDVFKWWWDNLIMWWHDRLQAGIVVACQAYVNHLTPVLMWIRVMILFVSFFVLPHVCCNEYGLVSCKPLSLYTQNREAVMRVPWPWIKAVIRSGGMGVSGWDREGGTP